MTNNIARQFVCSSVALTVIAIASAPSPAQSPRSAGETASEINAANNLLREGKVEEALAAFHRVVPGDQQRDELNYNMAVAEYRNGNIDAAEKLFSEVAGTGLPAISSSSRYNLGNCKYAKAVQLAEQDKPAAIECLRDAVSHYRGALRGNSNNPDARANIELAGALIRKLEQEQKQQEQKDQSEQKNDSQQDGEQQKSDSKDSTSDQQKKDQQKNQGESSASDKSDKSDKDEQKEDTQQGEKPGDKSQKPDEQSSPGEESPSSQQKPSEQQTQPQGSDGKQTQTQNKQTQSGDQQQPDDEGMPEEQDAKDQPVPAGDLKADDEQDEKSRKPVGSGAMADLKAKEGLMTREEALKMLQSVRDRDMLRRMQQLRQERSRHVPVDRDW